jgi:glycosyltransferase involved in cell wall biosynthesis
MHDLLNFNLELHIFTSQTPDELETHGIKSNQIVFHAHVPYHEIIEQQRKADILFLPLAFESPIPEVIRTSAPGKMGEYLISGRPVLAHVPGNSFVANFFTNHKCGWLAEQNDAGNLAAVIQQIITQPVQRRLLTQNARKIAALEFSSELAREQLMNRLLRESHRE